MKSEIKKLWCGLVWPYQPHFELALRSALAGLLQSIGYEGHSDIEVISLKWDAKRTEYDLYVRETMSGIDPSTFSGIEEAAQLLYEQHPRYRMIQSDADLHERQHAALRQNMRGRAFADLLEARSEGSFVYFDGHPAMVGDYEVYVFAGVDRVTYDSIPSIQRKFHEYQPVLPSFPYAVVRKFLTWSTRALQAEGVGASTINAGPDEISRGAVEDFVHDLFMCAGQWFGHSAVKNLNYIAAMPYEGRSCVGRIVVGKRGHGAVRVNLALTSSVRLDNGRATRKLLEGAGREFRLLSDGESIYGLGEASYKPDGDPGDEDIFEVAIETRGVWSVEYRGAPLVRVSDGAPGIPRLPLNERYFRDIVGRLLGLDADVEHLLLTARAIGAPEHGAMLVISASAAAEAQRLSSQAWTTDPSLPSLRLVRQLTNMDGATLVDVTGTCHAIGVILDGNACEVEDSSRGSRYNNAQRYVSSPGRAAAVVVVFSSDGSVDILPKLMPRVSRKDVADAVKDYDVAVSDYVEKRNLPKYGPRSAVAGSRKRVELLSFYLSQSQCDVVNEARDREHESSDGASIRVVERYLRPDSAMNDSYLLD